MPTLDDYIFVLVFIVLWIGLIFSELGMAEVYELEYPEIERPPPIDLLEPVAGDGLVEWIQNIVIGGVNISLSIVNVISNIPYLITLMTVDIGLGALGNLIFFPLFVMVFLKILHYIRGTG